MIHDGFYQRHTLRLRDIGRYILEGLYDLVTGNKRNYISPDRIVWLEKGGWIDISVRSDVEAEDLEDLFS